MNERQLFRALGDVDDSLLEAAERLPHRKKPRHTGLWIAACLCLAALSLAAPYVALFTKGASSACALELVHNYSLIHDDLPCMDNDDLRRGKPTNHKVYGETLAVLAGDALQPEAFRLISQAPGLSAESRITAVEVLAKAAGADGMVAGQVLDTLCDVREESGLTQLDRLKTCAMISAAAELGCVAAGMNADKRRQAREFGDGLGLAFQLRDDILDVTGAQEVFGKPIGSDKAEGKVTFVDLLGVDGCQREVEAQTKRAKAAVAGWADSDFLRELADRMVLRVK